MKRFVALTEETTRRTKNALSDSICKQEALLMLALVHPTHPPARLGINQTPPTDKHIDCTVIITRPRINDLWVFQVVFYICVSLAQPRCFNKELPQSVNGELSFTIFSCKHFHVSYVDYA